jgi:transcriptional regulator with XRE-family HTH domain
MKTKERELVRNLRKEQGLAIKQIAKRVGVSTSSVSLWVRDICLTEEQKKKLKEQNLSSEWLSKAWEAKSQKYREDRLKFQEEGRKKAKDRDPDHIAGCMLYWGEGLKNKNKLALSNSDPNLIKFFYGFLKKYFGVSRSDVVLSIFCHIDLATKEEIEKYWCETLSLPTACLRKTMIVGQSNRSGKSRKLKYGICCLTVYNTHIVQHVFGAIQEYANFNNPEFLDRR